MRIRPLGRLGVAIGLAALVTFVGCEDGAGQPNAGESGSAVGEVAPIDDLGTGYVYSEETLSRFRKLLAGRFWELRDRPRNSKGMLQVGHVRTGLTFVLVPAGKFKMGAQHGASREEPIHEVRLQSFLLCETECTQKAYDRIGGEDFREWQRPELPIESVRWTAVTTWCREAGLRLPSEAEWEYSCRAGSTGKWCFGDDTSHLGDYAVYKSNSGGSKPVAGKKPNTWGLFDMHGNVLEWCSDSWHADYEDAPTDGSAWVSHGASDRVLRGGSWSCPPILCRSSNRFSFPQHYQNDDLGFRPASDLPKLVKSSAD